MTEPSLLHPRDEILHTIERIYRYRMTTTSGGNLSIREPNGDIWITPARADKGSLRAADIVLVRANGATEGNLPPSSELPLHQAIYRTRPDVRGIVHAHPVALVAFSMVHQIPNTRLFHQAFEVCGAGGFAPYALPGTEALGVSVAGAFANGCNSVILENHGVVTVGADLREAFLRFETFEFTGKTIIKANLLGAEAGYLTDDDLARAARRETAMPEFQRDAIPSEERELRTRLAEFVQRAYRQRLFISTHGSFSARLSATPSFLITPYRADRGAIQPADLALIDNARAETNSSPSRAAGIHHAIYLRHPHIGAIINAHPVNATAFSVTGAGLDTRTIPESYVVVRKPGVASYEQQFGNPDAIADLLTPEQPALIVQNGGVLVTGRDILEAFDRLEVLESTAEAIINARALGVMKPMPDSVIHDLDAAFFKPAL